MQTGELATHEDTEPARHGSSRADVGPILVAGADRSGTTLIFALLASHPNISMVRRTNMWRYFYRRYGDLGEARNLDRCLDDMIRYRRMAPLSPDGERIRREFLEGPATYGRLFELFHAHNAERAGRGRWGDKSLHTEHYVDAIFTEFPNARIIHMIRDPRDRYASVRKRHGQDLSRVGAATGRWLDSTRVARRNLARHPGGYMILRYEDLAADPEATMRRVCAFIGEGFEPAMLAMGGAAQHRDTGGNSSFGDIEPGAISTTAIGRFRTVLRPWEIAFIELAARRHMRALGYRRTGVRPPAGERARFYTWHLPTQAARMVGWVTLARIRRARGVRIPSGRLQDRAPSTEPPRGA